VLPYKVIYNGGLMHYNPQYAEGDNDGLCSVESSKWGNYIETLNAGKFLKNTSDMDDGDRTVILGRIL
jgi:hypothetical protein